MKVSNIRKAVKANLSWFQKSGIMFPADGTWGVGERVALNQGNEAIGMIMERFPAWTDCGSYLIIEQRRADCNFQLATLFLEASRCFNSPKYRRIGENLLDFLYFRSGLLNRGNAYYQAGSWNWSHIKRDNCVYFDDEAWCVFLQLKIAEEFPELEAKYQMRHWAMILADELFEALKKALEQQDNPDNPEWYVKFWRGEPSHPHFGSLACMALLAAEPVAKKDYSQAWRPYFDYMLKNLDSFSSSETAYALIGLCKGAQCGRITLDELEPCAQRLIAKQDANGNIPAEHAAEAPTGPQLVDLIYTSNWAFWAFNEYKKLGGNPVPFDKMLELIIAIQDNSAESHLCGCWRGMFDLASNTYAGGDRYEGGANSIYSGWTNAPIALTLLDALR